MVVVVAVVVAVGVVVVVVVVVVAVVEEEEEEEVEVEEVVVVEAGKWILQLCKEVPPPLRGEVAQASFVAARRKCALSFR